MAVEQEELENLDSIEDFEDQDDDFEDTPESRGDILKDDDVEDDEPEEVVEIDDEDEPEEDEVPEEDEPEEDEVPEEDEPEEVPETDTPPKDDPKANVRVPLSRLEAEIARRKSAEERLAQVGQRDAVAEKQTSRLGEIANRLEELDEALAKASLEGDEKTFRQLRAEERQLNTEIMEARLQESTRRAVDQTRFEATLGTLETRYPQINPDSSSYDAQLEEEVVELMEAFAKAGHAKHVALQRAVSYVFPDVPEVEAPPPPPKAKKTLRSTETPKNRNRQAKRQQPPSTSGRRSVEEPKVDPMAMSDEEFDRWVDSKEGRAARGDFL